MLRRPRVMARYVASQQGRTSVMRTVGATICLALDHSWTPLEYMRVRIDVSNDGTHVLRCEPGPVYIGCARCLIELPPYQPPPPAPIDIVDR